MAERKRRGGRAEDGRPGEATDGSARRSDEVEEELTDDTVDGGAESDEELDDIEGDEEDELDEASEEDSSGGSGGTGVATKARAKSKAATDKKSGKGKATDRPGIFARFVNFFREVVAELRKVIWPTRPELLTYTAVVVVFVAIMLTVVGLLDVGFAKGVLWVFGNKTSSDH